MKPQKLEIGLLKFIKSTSNIYNFVELRPFLLHNFPEEKEMQERLKMKRFIKFLEDGDFIEIQSKRGIWIIVEGGNPVNRENISVIAKLTPKGLELLNQEKNNFYNKFGIVSAFLISLFSLGYSYFESQNSKQLETEIINISGSVKSLRTEINKQKLLLNNQKEMNAELRKKIKQLDNLIKEKE